MFKELPCRTPSISPRRFANTPTSSTRCRSEGTTVGDLLSHLTTTYPELKKHLYNEQGKLRHFVNIYVNDEDIRYLQKEQTALGTADTISIIPSVAGGAPAARRTCRRSNRRKSRATAGT